LSPGARRNRVSLVNITENQEDKERNPVSLIPRDRASEKPGFFSKLGVTPTAIMRNSEVSHNSCFLLISSEKPREIASLEKENYPCRSFILGSLGMASKEILREYQLSDEEDWETLINTYQSHPFW